MAVYRRASRRRYVLLVIILTSVTLITLDSRREDEGAIGAVGRGAHAVVSPFEKGVDAVAEPVSDWFAGVTDGGSLKKDNEELRKRVAELEDEQRAAEVALEQNETFRRLLDLPILADVPRVTARVVNRSPGNFEWTVTIDKGEEHEIARDMPVVGPDGLVGKVLDSWKGGAKIRLLVDPDSNVGVSVLQRGKQGVANGRRGSDRLRVELDADADVKPGDDVVTSGVDNSVFPEGLRVGTVEEVDEQPGGLGVTARVRPWTDFDSLEYVTVLQWFPGQGDVVSTTTTSTTTTTVPSDTTSTTAAEGA